MRKIESPLPARKKVKIPTLAAKDATKDGAPDKDGARALDWTAGAAVPTRSKASDRNIRTYNQSAAASDICKRSRSGFLAPLALVTRATEAITMALPART